jgi:tetratricopeptide (TPR) repeat protein
MGFLRLVSTVALIAVASSSVSASDFHFSMNQCQKSKAASAKVEHCAAVIQQSKDPRVLERAFNSRGLANMELNRFGDAVNDFSAAIHLSPRIAGYYDNRQGAYKSLRRLDDALNDANMAVRLAPNYAFVYSSRGTVYDEMGRFDLAIGDYTTAISLDPRNAGLHFGRGKILAKAKRLQEAIIDFTHAFDLDRNLALALRERGLASKKLGNLEAARADLNLFRGVQPNDVEVAQALQELQAQAPRNPVGAGGRSDEASPTPEVIVRKGAENATPSLPSESASALPQPTPKVDAPSAPVQTQDLQGFSRQRAYEIGAKWKISPELIDDYVEHCGWRIGLFYNSPPGCKEYQAALARNMDPHLKQYLELSINEIGQEKDEKARALEALAAKKRALDARIEQERAQAEARQQQAAQQAELAETQRKAEEQQQNKLEEEQKKRAMAESNSASHSMAGASSGCDNALTRSEHCNDTPPPPAVDYTHQPLSCTRPDVVAKLRDMLQDDIKTNLLMASLVTGTHLDKFRTASTTRPINGASCVVAYTVHRGPNPTITFDMPYTIQMTDDGTDFVINYNR